MVIGRRVHPGWVSWKDLPGWLQGATYWACLNGGPLDTLDVVRLDTGLRTGASAREIFFREEPRWMVKTILLLQERGIIKEKFSTSEVHQAVALWWGLEEETIRRRCSGDMSLGKKGKWDWAMERAGTHGKNPRELIPTDMFHSDVPHDYTPVVLERFTRGNGNPQPNGKAAVIRIPGSYWVVAKNIFISSRKNIRFFGYWLMDGSKLPGTEIQSSNLDRAILREYLGSWIDEKDVLPRLSMDAERWLDSFAPIQPEAGLQ